MMLDMYNFNRKLKIKGIVLSRHKDNEEDKLYYAGEFEEGNLYMTYSPKKQNLVIYEDSEYKKHRSSISLCDVDIFGYIFDCFCYDEADEQVVEVVERSEIEDKTLKIESKE